MRRIPLLASCLLLFAAPLQAAEPGLEQIMADPLWMGPPVEAAWWQLDGESVVYRVQRDDTGARDLYRIELATGDDTRIDYADHATLDGEDPVVHEPTGRAVFVRDGNLFVRESDADAPRQLTRALDEDARPAFSPDGSRLVFERDGQWWLLEFEHGLSWPVTDLRFEENPDAEPEDQLEKAQLRLFSSLAEDARRARAEREEARRAAAEDPTRAPAPWHLGESWEAISSRLSPDGRWLLLAVAPADHDGGRDGQMPHYVTVDGYVDVETVRTRVGRSAPAPQSLWLLDLHAREKHTLDLSALAGIDEDPLAELKAEQDIDPLADDALRDVTITGIEWHPEADRAAVQLRAIDNKDRWIAVVDPANASLQERHRLTDPGWINWAFNDFGWVPGSRNLWLLSEQSGYSHLYTIGADRGRLRAVTSGEFEVMDPEVMPDGRTIWALSNRAHPTEYDLYRIDLQRGRMTRITEHRGIESFAVLPGSERVLVRYSESYLPPQVALVGDDGTLEPLTDTRSEKFRDMDWQAPEIVAVPSTHGAGEIWSKFYPARSEPPGDGGHPVVLFVHGAGYLQNIWHRYPQYFREQMFHNLLTARGYHVLDMDFRASRGYGRDWRTAIYRQMGTPELEDLVDGVTWLVEQHDADPERVGLYGGSYGGFMAFMAMFNAPEVFAAGAALRPVTDWMHYNHNYTSNILNTPDVDPEAYARSSPIEFAGGLEGHLLMTHGMLDDNVFYQDVVRLAQRLIDLEKEHWELASYPLERHAFSRPSSWLDQYRRVLALFERTIGAD